MRSGAPEHLDPTLFQWFRVRLRDGRIGAPIAHLRAADDRGKGYYVDTSGGGFFGRTFPFQGGEKYAVSDDGAWLAVAEDEEPREEESAFRLTLVRTSGEQVYAGRYRVQTGTIPSSMIDSVLGAGFDAIVNSRSSRLSGSRLRAIART
jgi:glycine/D-amino acid oxidase-like deaminating enzyme